MNLLLYVSTSDLLTAGASFQINHQNMVDRMDRDILDELGSDDNDDDDDDLDSRMSPWKKSFDELKLLMEKVPNPWASSIHKRIIKEGRGDIVGTRNGRIGWTYHMYFENQDYSFDSVDTPKMTAKEDLLPGLQAAVGTMRKNEEAQFIIGYKLMFGEMGFPPRIKPKADILFVVKLINFTDTGDEKACDDVSEEDRRKFKVMKEKIMDLSKKAQDYTKVKNYKSAIGLYQSAIRNLEFCQLANEDEQKVQEKLLIEFNINLMECYANDKNWRKVCLVVNELRRRTDVERNVKILYNEGIALSFIEDDYVRSIERLRKAQRLEPHNQLVNNKLNEILAKAEKYKQERAEMSRRMFKTMAIADKKSE